MVLLARENAKKAGVDNAVRFYESDVRKFVSPVSDARGTIITNPPYGERLGEISEARDLYKAMGSIFDQNIPAWQKYIITSDEMFERYFGKRSDKKRVLYNGMIKCNLYQYFKPRKN
jgi:putative N6-adenine-specific DNA methylase